MSNPKFERTAGERELIGALAHSLHEAHADAGGCDVEDWLAAEEQLITEGTITADPREVAPSQQGPIPADDGQITERPEAAAAPLVR